MSALVVDDQLDVSRLLGGSAAIPSPRASGRRFAQGVDDLVELKKSGLSEAVIAAMLEARK